MQHRRHQSVVPASRSGRIAAVLTFSCVALVCATLWMGSGRIPTKPGLAGNLPTHPPVALNTTQSSEQSSLSGTVVDREGQPVENADVWLYSRRLGTEVLRGRSQTDGRGRFRFNADEPICGPTVWAISQDRVTCAKHGGGSRSLPSEIFRPDFWQQVENDRLILKLPEKVEYDVFRVRDGDDANREGVRVLPDQFSWPNEFSGIPIPEHIAERLSVRTNVDGVARLPRISGMFWNEVRVLTQELGEFSFNRYIAGMPEPGEKAPTEELVIKLTPTETVVCRVGCDELESLRGRSVTLVSEGWHPDPEAGMPRQTGVSQRVVAIIGDDGILQNVPKMIPGELTVARFLEADELLQAQTVSMPIGVDGMGEMLGDGPQAEAAPMESGKHEKSVPVTFEIPVRRAVRLNGVVRTRDAQTPVPNYTLRITSGNRSWQDPLEVTSDKEGRFSALVIPGSVSLQAWPVSGQDQFDKYTNADRFEPRSDVVPDGVTEFALAPFDLIPVTSLSGRVLDKDGKPLEDWEIVGYPVQPVSPFGSVVHGIADPLNSSVSAISKAMLVVSVLSVTSLLDDCSEDSWMGEVIEVLAVEIGLAWENAPERDCFRAEIGKDGTFQAHHPIAYRPVAFAARRADTDIITSQNGLERHGRTMFEIELKVIQKSPLILQMRHETPEVEDAPAMNAN